MNACVRGCTIRIVDPDGVEQELPREATRGFLCSLCYHRTVDALAAWGQFRALLEASGGRLVTPERGGTTTSHSHLGLVFLTINECEGFLASRGGMTVDAWVQDRAGAKDAIRFAIAAERAYRDLEVTERPHETVKARCPQCQQIVLRNTRREERGATVVECSHCGYHILTVRPDSDRVMVSPSCEHVMHEECEHIHCECPCHELGDTGRPMGVKSLFDADWAPVDQKRATATKSLPERARWVVEDAVTIRPKREEKAA